MTRHRWLTLIGGAKRVGTSTCRLPTASAPGMSGGYRNSTQHVTRRMMRGMRYEPPGRRELNARRMRRQCERRSETVRGAVRRGAANAARRHTTRDIRRPEESECRAAPRSTSTRTMSVGGGRSAEKRPLPARHAAWVCHELPQSPPMRSPP